MCIVPTGSEQVTYNWASAPLRIYASDDEISPAAPVNVWVDSDGWGKPPYQWQVSGTGYTLSETMTTGDFDPTTVSVVSGTCGVNYAPYVTVTVTDANGVHDSMKIRNPGGQWSSWRESARTHCWYQNIPGYGTAHCISCAWAPCNPGSGACSPDEIYVHGVIRYRIRYGCSCVWWDSPNHGFEWCQSGGQPLDYPSECLTPSSCEKGRGPAYGCSSQGICMPDGVEKSTWGCAP